MKIIPIILSGGSGERLWPLSRKQFPKQYLPLNTKNTMLQETLLRLNGIKNLGDPIIVCNSDHRFFVADQCNDINITNPTILLEPVRRNTAPAITAAVFQSLKISHDAVLLVLSADHVIEDIEEFHEALEFASNQVKNDMLITFGILPLNPCTEYGYIKFKHDLTEDKKISSKTGYNKNIYKVEQFFEKPDTKKAKSYLKQENYLWNSGMFMFQGNTFIKELEVYAPKITSSVSKAFYKAKQDIDFIRLDKKAFELSPSESIDYALMEKSNKVSVVPLDVKWSDVGSWTALDEIGLKDGSGNVKNGDVFSIDTKNTYIYAKHHLIATIGIKDLVVVDSPDATLIASKDKIKDVKKIIKLLQEQDRKELSTHRKVYRPWGWYDLIEEGIHFQVKRLHVNPNAKLSLQMHLKRSEHWVVVNGKASVINGEQTLTLSGGESTYIPVGTKHELANKTNEALEIIEVQSGTYLGEDDIIRFEDLYGREES